MVRTSALLLGALLVGCGSSSNEGADGADGGENDGAPVDATSGEAGDASHPGDGGSVSDGSGTDASGPPAMCDAGAASTSAVWPLGTALTPSSMTTDPQGNVYVVGSFSGSTTIGGMSLVATGAVDMFLVKLSPTGQTLSATHFGATNAYEDPVPVVTSDAAGNVYLAGFFSDTLHFGGTSQPVTAILVDAFVVKFDATGSAVWSKRFGYDQGPYAILSVALAPNGDPIVAGTAAGTIVIGSSTLAAPDPPGSGDTQPFVARLAAADGTPAWAVASGGNIDTDKVQIATDAMGRSFLVARALGGESAWGVTPEVDGGAWVTLRAAFDPNGVPLWSQLDIGGFPTAVATDEHGRVAVVENTFESVATGGMTFGGVGQATVPLLFDPNDGTLLSGTTVANTFPWAGSTGAKGFTFVTGQYTGGAATFGSILLPSPGPPPQHESLYVAQIDPTSHFVWAAGIGAGNTQPLAVTVDAMGRALVAGTTDTAFSTPGGMVPVGNFIAVFGPAICEDDPGPSIGPGDGSRGDLLDASPILPDGAPASCPATQGGATNGAACPAMTGCQFGSTCCFCTPNACGSQPTTWTCDPLPSQNASCPSTPPQAAGSCPTGVQCNYCLPGGRYFADCTAGGWDVGYAQVVCE